jgi:hypothetical protein
MKNKLWRANHLLIYYWNNHNEKPYGNYYLRGRNTRFRKKLKPCF